MNRFSKEFRGGFGNRVARHFDKYCEISNPVTFDPLHDLYKEAFTRKEWAAMNVLLSTKTGRLCLDTSDSFIVYLPTDSSTRTSAHLRKRITFGFPDEVWRPSLDIEYIEINPQARKKLDSWIKKMRGLKELRMELWDRCDKLLDWGWHSRQVYGTSGWRGGPTPGQGCNTPGQVYRIWPELLPFLNIESRGQVRCASAKSRLPDIILEYGSINQFLCLEKTTNDDGDEQSDEELIFARRRFDALTHILVQMSLMMEVSHDNTYPSTN